MDIIIQSPHVTLTSELRSFVTAEVDKLSNLFYKLEGARVFLKMEKSGIIENKICEIRLEIPGHDLFIEKQSDSFEEATTEAVDELKEELAKLKSKLMDKR